MLYEMYYNILNVWFLQLMPATCQTQIDRKTDRSLKTAMPMWTRLDMALCKIIMATTKVNLAPEKSFQFIYKT